MKRCFYFILAVSLILMAVTAIGQPVVKSFTPSGGWVGSDYYNGTRVRILGSGFAADSSANSVFFKRGGNSLVQAEIVASFPDESLYAFKTQFGSHGTTEGSLNSPTDVAVDTDGNVYVANYINKRVEVFDWNGTYIKQLANGLMDSVVGIAFDVTRKRVYICGQKFEDAGVTGYVYGLSAVNGSVVTTFSIGTVNPSDIVVDEKRDEIYVHDQSGGSWIRKYKSSGQFLLDLKKPLFGIGTTKYMAFDQDRDVLYIPAGNQILKYVNSIYKESIVTASSNQGIAVDADGYIYLSFRFGKPFRKYQRNGTLISEFGDSGDFPAGVAPGIDVDENKRIYAVDPVGCECVKVYAPRESGELIVTVPPHAVTGTITVETDAVSATSEYPFTIFSVGETSVKMAEVTQGLSSYSFVTNKPTMVYAKFDGLFGAPGRDVANVCIFGPSGAPCITRDFDRYDFVNGNKDTIAYYTVPKEVIRQAGDYRFKVYIARDGKVLKDEEYPHTFSHTEELTLLFIKFTNTPKDQWGQTEPFKWFDVNVFFKGIETFKRVYPVAPFDFKFHITEAATTLNLKDVKNSENYSKFSNEMRDIKKPFHFDGSAFVPDRAVGLIDKNNASSYNAPPGTNNGVVSYTYFPYANYWGAILAHEVGHSYFLVDKGQSNAIETKGGIHSKNLHLDKEYGAPVTAWNALTGKLIAGKDAYSIMNQYANTNISDHLAFFESRDSQKEKLEYHKLHRDLKTETKRRIGFNGAMDRFVMIGRVSPVEGVGIHRTYVTQDNIPLTGVVDSEYFLAFLDDRGERLSLDGIPIIPFQDLEQVEGGTFDVVRPYPPGTARVEVRKGKRALIALTPSAHPPVVENVTVEVPEFMPVEIRWTASDTDGNPLTFSVFYSADGGEHFVPLVVGLSETEYIWHDRLSYVGGSSKAVVRVTANDGFHMESADSSQFILPGKVPLVEILMPADGTTFTEGSVIDFLGAGFDAEDGHLNGIDLVWTLDGTVPIGTGEHIQIQDLPRRIPGGTVPMPLEIGTHTIRLTVEDGEGNVANSEIIVLIQKDTDRDGVSDVDEDFLGGDPVNPFVQPADMDRDEDGLADTSEDRNRNGIPDEGETDFLDPDTDGDGLADGLELGAFEPETGDTDLDSGFFKPDEDMETRTDPTRPDTDGDGLTDGEEDANRNGRVDPDETDPLKTDTDEDGVPDGEDFCLNTGIVEIIDEKGCSIDQYCPCENFWKNHGKYVSCVAKSAEDFIELELITPEMAETIVNSAAKSDCTRK